MNINELRIDCLVNLENEPFRVIGINPPYVDLLGNGNRIRMCDVDSDNLQPILLNEEFFKNNGFVMNPYEYGGYCFTNTDVCIDAIETEFGWCIHIDDVDRVTVFEKCLKYVHELQNIYYVVNGKELSIKL